MLVLWGGGRTTIDDEPADFSIKVTVDRKSGFWELDGW
jgi:hypothetical protein